LQEARALVLLLLLLLLCLMLTGHCSWGLC
jgi:hypothetical protein